MTYSVPPCGVRAVETMQGRFPTVSYITAEEATGEEEWNSAPKKRQLLDSDEEEDDEGRRQVSGTPRVHRKKRFQIEDEDD